jgi:D-aminoacyl-tRNA deacylase
MRMRAVVQLVANAFVTIDEKKVAAIDAGLVILLGIHRKDSEKDAAYLAEKILNLRIFADERGLMNRSVLEEQGEVLVVSQFTLFGDCRKGRRPSYSQAAPPEKARELYQSFCNNIQASGLTVATGEFQAMMKVTLTNNGPVTLLLDSHKIS